MLLWYFCLLLQSTATPVLFAKLKAFEKSDLIVKGTVNVTEQNNTLHLTLFLSGLPSSSSGGIHIHKGTSCYAAESVGPHFFANKKTNKTTNISKRPSDPWADSKWTSNERGFATNQITVDAGKTLPEVLGHAVVVHAPTNDKIACGLLVVYGIEDKPPPAAEEEDDLGSSVVGALTVFGLALGACCVCRLYESCKRIRRKRQGRDRTGFSALPMVQTGAVDSEDLDLEMVTKGKGKKRAKQSLNDLENSSDGFSDIDSDSDVGL